MSRGLQSFNWRILNISWCDITAKLPSEGLCLRAPFEKPWFITQFATACFQGLAEQMFLRHFRNQYESATVRIRTNQPRHKISTDLSVHRMVKNHAGEINRFGVSSVAGTCDPGDHLMWTTSESAVIQIVGFAYWSTKTCNKLYYDKINIFLGLPLMYHDLRGRWW